MEDQKADIQDQQRKSYLRSLDVLTHPESALILSFDTNANLIRTAILAVRTVCQHEKHSEIMFY